MNKFSFAVLSDILFYAFSAFVLALSLLRFYRAALWLSLLTATLVFFAVGALSALFLLRKRQKKILGKREHDAREALMLHLALEKPERVRAALIAAFLAEEKNAHCEGDVLRVDDLPLIPLFTMEPVGADAVANLIRNFGKDFSLACNSLTEDAVKLIRTFGIKAQCGDEIYALFTRTGTTPDPLICGEIPRKTGKQKLKSAFSKTNARPFFASGSVLLLMSLFTLFPLYYVISGSILLLCSVVVRLFGYA